MWFIIVLGIICFLLMEHALVFWLLFIPLALLCIVFAVKWFKGGRGTDIAASLIAIVAIVIVLLIVCIP